MSILRYCVNCLVEKSCYLANINKHMDKYSETVTAMCCMATQVIVYPVWRCFCCSLASTVFFTYGSGFPHVLFQNALLNL